VSKNLRNSIGSTADDCSAHAADGQPKPQQQQQQQTQKSETVHAENLFMKLLLSSGYLCRNGNSLSIPNQELREKLMDNISKPHFMPKYNIDIAYYNNVTSILSTILNDPENVENFPRLQQQFQILLNEANKGASFLIIYATIIYDQFGQIYRQNCME
jgi:hypothetical protein